MTSGFKVIDATGRIKTANDPSGMVIGSTVEAWDADLDALAAQTGSGVVCRTALNTYAQRVITGAPGIVVTDGGGITGNPTISVNPALGIVMTGPISVTDAELRSLSSVPKVVVTGPATGILVVAHRVMIVTTVVAAFNTAPTYSLRYSGIATDLTSAVGFTNTTGAWFDTGDAVQTINLTGTSVLANSVVIRTSADLTLGTGSSAKVWVAYSLVDTN